MLTNGCQRYCSAIISLARLVGLVLSTWLCCSFVCPSKKHPQLCTYALTHLFCFYWNHFPTENHNIMTRLMTWTCLGDFKSVSTLKQCEAQVAYVLQSQKVDWSCLCQLLTNSQTISSSISRDNLLKSPIAAEIVHVALSNVLSSTLRPVLHSPLVFLRRATGPRHSPVAAMPLAS